MTIANALLFGFVGLLIIAKLAVLGLAVAWAARELFAFRERRQVLVPVPIEKRRRIGRS